MKKGQRKTKKSEKREEKSKRAAIKHIKDLILIYQTNMVTLSI